MKKSLFYIFMALVCAACTLAGCRKDEANKALEGVFWFYEGAPMTGVFLYDSTLDKYLLSNVGTEGHLWTIEKSPFDGNPHALKIGLRKTEISVGTSFTRASALAVRCLKENK